MKKAKVEKHVDEVKRAKPFLKWAGGKSRVVTEIAHHFPKDFQSYYEPFLGSAAMYFAVSPRKGRLNDLNRKLIDTYTIVRDRLDGLINELTQLQSEYWAIASIDEKKLYYLEKRLEYNMQSTKKTIRKAALFIFLNKTGFNGMYRENLSGKYNIPFGKHERPLICDVENLKKVSHDLRDIELTSGSYTSAVQGAKKGDLVYLDPPYYPLNSTSSFTEYQAGGFGKKDQAELRDKFIELDQRGCHVVMSNSACDEIYKLYKGYNIYTIKVARAINSKRDKRGKIDEVVITNFKVDT